VPVRGKTLDLVYGKPREGELVRQGRRSVPPAVGSYFAREKGLFCLVDQKKRRGRAGGGAACYNLIKKCSGIDLLRLDHESPLGRETA